MPQQITTALGKLGSTIKEFTIAQRTLALIGAAVLVLALVALSAWFAKPSYAPLYTGLAPADASAVVEQLNAEGVGYELADGGSTILVGRDDVYRMRLATAAAGLPASSDGGYSLLDEMGMSSSEFQQETTYKRAMEGELSKTIGAMKGVRSASVQLALPEKTVFVAEASDPTASVFVDVAQGNPLTDDQVQAVVHLVSASIEGMKPTDVALIDSTGSVLSAVGTGVAGGGGGTSKQTREYEQRIATSVQAMLDRVVGPGNAVVSVTAELDFSERQSTEQTYSAAEDVPPLSITESTEEYTRTGDNSAGVLGPDNIAVPDGEGGAGNYRNESRTANNSVNQLTQVTVGAPGDVKRQSVAVALNQQNAGALRMADVQAMVAAAAGIDEERGDVVTVSRMAFDATGAEVAQEALAAQRAEDEAAQRADLIRTAVIAGAALLLLIITAILVARNSRNKRLERETLDIGELNVIESTAALEGATAAALDAVEEAEGALALEAPAAPDPAVQLAEQQRAEVVALADEDPDEMAQMLRTWIEPGVRS